MNINIDEKMFLPCYLPDLFDYSKRYQVFYGGAGSGKSVYCCQKLIIRLLKENNTRLLVIRKVASTLKDSVWELFISTLSKWNLLDYCKVNLTTMTIKFPNGSVVLMKGLDDPEKIKSISNIDIIYIEEATELNLDDVTQLDLRLRSKHNNLQMYFSFNPVSKTNWTYHKWFENGYDETTTKVIKTTYKDNHFLPQSYIDALERKMKENYTYYRVYALGEYCSLNKLVYTNVEYRDFDYAKIQGKTLVGIDFGFTNDMTAIMHSILDEQNKTIYICREYCSTGMTNPMIAKKIQEMGLSKHTIIADSAEPKSITELRSAGIYNVRASVKGPDSVLHGVQKLQQYKLVVHTSCVNTKEELENYSYIKDKQSGEYTNKIEDKWNHCLDSLRYSLQCVNSTATSSVSKSMFF